ncbi:transcriptional regulator ATRX homolog isoform X2 [Anoplophora glabripennis]|uniref:transcriptional regulator ATRX homolog isoform X2 n=1 Tax=Anoplophora glabripennis TaxID=217634 RepID=UPI000874837B|nr:transcriptional regulator ATRX homolog isoform X2 [Anoplophora glabripennis]
MSKEEVLLELVLDKFSNIKEVLSGTKDIEDFLVKLKLNENEEVDVILKKAKNLIDCLYDHSVIVKDEFYKKYNALENLTEQENNGHCEKAVEENSSNIESVMSTENLVNTEIENQTQENIEHVEGIIEEERDNLNVEENGDKEVEEENHNNLEEDPLKNSESPNIIESSILEDNEEKENLDNEKQSSDQKPICEENKPEHKSLIRLVDLSKLIDPKQKKSVKFDSSIIVLTSSDEETQTPKKTSDANMECGLLKSALKPPNSDGDNCSKSKGKELLKHLKSSKTKHKTDSEESDSDVTVSKTLQNEKKTKGQSKHDKTSSKVSSDSDVQEFQEKETGSKKYKKKRNYEENGNKKSINKDVIKDNSQHNSESESDNLSGDENTTNKETEESKDGSLRKSRRLKNNQTSKEKERASLKKLFKRTLTRGNVSCSETKKKSREESSSDSESGSIRKRKVSGKKSDLIEKELSDTSSLSNTETDISATKSKTKKNSTKRTNDSILHTASLSTKDEKFKCEVYIPLPRIECERMKEIYLKNKEIFEIKRLTKLNLSKKQKRSRGAKNDTDKSSSDDGKSKSKKLKNVASEKKPCSEEEVSTDDEPFMESKNNDISETDQDLGESTNNKDEQMADIVVEKLKEFDDEKKTQSSNSESEGESNNSEAQKKKDEEKAPQDKTDDEEKEKSVDNVNETEMEEGGETKISEDENSQKGDDEKEKNSEDKKEKEQKAESESDSDNEKKKSKKKNWRKDKLLTVRIDSSDSEEELKKYHKKKDQSKDESLSDSEIKSPIIKKRKVKKRVRKAVVSSDSDGSNKNNRSSGSSKKTDSSDENKSDSDSDKKEEVTKKTTRKRIKRTNDSSSSDEDKSTRKNIRKVIGRDSLSETTKQAEAEEKERKARIAEKQKKYNKIFEFTADSKVDKVVLDYDEEKKEELLAVDKKVVKKLKPHQASGVQFMWDACFESIERAKNTKGSGCILAHCMGLGKTLQVIALSHTLLRNAKSTGVRKVMVVCPLNTVLNWKSEYKKWMPRNDEFEVFELVSSKQNYERQYIVTEWCNDGGVLIIGYTMFRNLSNPDNKRLSKKMRNVFNEGLVDPGPDLVVCDEGHLLKNEKTHLNIAMNRIKTLRRIVLTGTPLQNNLKEYWCMVQFIKPNLLGTYKEYLNRFVNPITNGQYTDSTQHDILLMRKRSHVLHKLLDGVVQRRDYAVLEPYLPPKYEYVLFIQLTETQVKIYSHYMDRFARQNDGSNRTSFLFADFQELQRICTHPRVLLDKSNERKEKELDEDSEGSLKDFIDDGEASSEKSSASSSSGSNSDSDGSGKDKDNRSKRKQQRVRVTRAQAAQRRENNEESDPELEVVKKEWFQEYCDGKELDNINNSGKLFLLFQILKECEEIGDKVLVFSQSLYTLNCIEYFLEKIDEATQNGTPEKVGGHSGAWSIGLDYFRLDGTSSCDNRAIWCNMFNNPNNIRARLFLISTKAGGLGINLVAANRVIIFDVSWNPSHDIQSIYRVYRFGQTKPCYIYRFVTYGTMEMKIYERQVTKQAISKRVIDEQQIDRHYNQNDLQELYKCDLEPTDRPIPMVPKDVLLGELLQKYEKTIYKYHLHQSLLENKADEGLNEEERKAAWEEFENEKVLRKNTGTGLNPNFKVNAQAIETALASIVRKDNPTWTDVQIKGIIPALVQQLQVQLSEGDMTMYARVQQEIQLMQEMQAQKLREAYYQQQVMRMIQRQQQQAKLMGNLYVDPNQLGRMPGGTFNNPFSGNMNMNQGGPSTAPRFSNDVIELND